MVEFLFESFNKWIQGTGYDLECTGWQLDQCQCVPFCVDKLQEFHWTSYHFPVALKASLLFDVHLDEWVLSWPQLYLSFHTWCSESLSQTFESIFSKELIFDLDVKHMFYGVKFVWIQTSRWTKWDGLVKPFQSSFWVVQFESSIGKQVCTQDDVVFDVIIVKD